MPKTLTETTSILTVHEGAKGQYILRIGALRWRPLVIQITKLLEDAESFVIITPGDVKVFEVQNENETHQSESEEVPDGGDADIPADPVVPDEPAEEPATRTRRRKKNESVAGHDTPCQRCGGSGAIQAILPNGQSTEASCGVCSGSGVIRRFGVR